MGAVAKAVGNIFTGGGDKAPKPPEPVMPPPAAMPPTLADAGQSVLAQNAKGKAAAGASMSGTVLTSPQGLKTKASTAKGSLLSGAVGGDE